MNNARLLTNLKVDFFIEKERSRAGVIIPKQCHKNKIVFLETGLEEVEECDALVTKNHQLKIGVYTADCAPVAFSDGEKIGIAHVGWRGLCTDLLEKMLSLFDSKSLEVFVGPHLQVFEIQRDDCYELIARTIGTDFFHELDGKIFFNFKKALASCLPIEAIFDERNTATEMSLPSHRRGDTDRIITVVEFKN